MIHTTLIHFISIKKTTNTHIKEKLFTQDKSYAIILLRLVVSAQPIDT